MFVAGDVALWTALSVALWAGFLGILGARRGHRELMRVAGWGAAAVLALVGCAVLLLAAAFLANDVTLASVHAHSSGQLSLPYRLGAFWSGPSGSLLIWVVVLAGAAAWLGSGRRPRGDAAGRIDERPAGAAGSNRTGVATAGLVLGLLSLLLGLVLLPESPFAPLEYAAVDGRGMRPDLQNVWLLVHPPLVVTGLALLAVPGLLVSGAQLAKGRVVGGPERIAGWVRGGWLLLTLGLLAGMRWANSEVGWGGWWYWDPVQNATLLVWLVAAALLHSLTEEGRTGRFRSWNAGLCGLLLVLVLLAGVAARSGIFESLHSFAVEPRTGRTLLTASALAALGCGWVTYRTLRDARPAPVGASGDRGAASVLVSHAVLLGVAGVVGWGTVFPLLATAATGEPVALGASWFGTILAPLGVLVPALLLVGAQGPGPWWTRGRLAALLPGLAAAIGLLLAGVRQPLAVVAIGMAVAALAALALGGVRRTAARARMAHAGLALVVIGVAGGALEVTERATVEPGDRVSIASPLGPSYSLRYAGLSSQAGAGTWELIASFRIERSGRGLGFLDARQQVHQLGMGRGSRAGIRSGLLEDLRLTLVALEADVGLGTDPDRQGATVQLSVHPFASWIWIGGLLVVLGAGLAGGLPRTCLPRGVEPLFRRRGPSRTESPDGSRNQTDPDPRPPAP